MSLPWLPLLRPRWPRRPPFSVCSLRGVVASLSDWRRSFFRMALFRPGPVYETPSLYILTGPFRPGQNVHHGRGGPLDDQILSKRGWVPWPASAGLLKTKFLGIFAGRPSWAGWAGPAGQAGCAGRAGRARRAAQARRAGRAGLAGQASLTGQAGPASV